jgi:mono/diheme cytochrome c family protein
MGMCPVSDGFFDRSCRRRRLGVAGLRAQTVLGDPRDAARTFASNCSACHKSPRGLAKSGSAGFLRQHTPPARK